MDCAALKELTQVPPEKLNAYIECSAPAAGSPQMQAVTAAQGVFFWSVIVAAAISQLRGSSNLLWIRMLWGALLVSIAGLLYSAFRL